MAQTLQVQISDAVIKRYAGDLAIGELKDPRHPLRFRYRNDRSKGSWHLVRYDGGGKWKKAANWPDVPARVMLDSLPVVQARLLADPASAATVDGWERVGQVLDWYAERLRADNSLSKSRRASTRSAISCQLLPALGELHLSKLNADTLDRHLVWHMQAEYSLSYVKSVLDVLKVVFGAALALKKVTVNPLVGVSFKHFTKAKIRPKGARLRHVAVVDLLAEWAEAFADDPAAVTLLVLMLTHATRITETRLAKWKNIHLEAGEWFIPGADTKSKRDHLLPLTPQAVAFLQRYRDQQKARGYDGAYLFPSTAHAGRSMSRSQAFAVFTRYGAGEWTSHDLRKLARTTLGELDVDGLVAKLLLNHSLTDLEATYFQSRGEVLKCNALNKWHAWLDAQGFDALQDKTGARRAVKPTAVDPAGWLA
ncbi:tyrosine-type recombinase/integrase [Pseudomonas helleri]|uniref:tyrosine-type recombinase/integrase n=1 Tax=Pseudomonas helleri TaxID=1608996 RepID=UPI0012964340|nr:site-specific integrase [Pseudomonas helleri]MQU22154.1 tyrosine-type recombinase/integrase [Pseudomonas helleri]